MATSHFVEVTDEEINCFRESAYFSNNHVIDVIILKQLFTNIHLAFGE